MRQTDWTTNKPTIQKILNGKFNHDILISCIFECHNIDSGCCKTIKDTNKTTGKKYSNKKTIYHICF